MEKWKRKHYKRRGKLTSSSVLFSRLLTKIISSPRSDKCRKGFYFYFKNSSIWLKVCFSRLTVTAPQSRTFWGRYVSLTLQTRSCAHSLASWYKQGGQCCFIGTEVHLSSHVRKYMHVYYESDC